MQNNKLFSIWNNSILLVVLAFHQASYSSPSQSANSVVLKPGQNIQAIVDKAPPATKFIFLPGVYRLQQITPKTGDAFIGQKGAIMSGAQLLAGFTKQGAYWVVSGQTQAGQIHGSCLASAPRCDHPEEVYRDDKPLKAVAQLSDLKTGSFYFDYDKKAIILFDNPSGHRLEASVTRAAFEPNGATGVTVEGLVIEKYAIPAQMGAIGDQTGAIGWTIQNNEVRLNHGAGIRAGSRTLVLGNYVHDNGQQGITGNGDGILLERNEIARNNYAGFNWNWEAGGSKFAVTTDLKMRCNFVHDNARPGLWTDTDNIGTVYEGNLIVNNQNMGIFHEISNKAEIRNNIVKGNGASWYPWLWGANIQISTSQNVNVHDNIVEVSKAGGNGIAIVQQNRGSGKYGLYQSANNSVTANTITYLAPVGKNPVDVSQGLALGGMPLTGAIADYNLDQFWLSKNTFDGNTYHLPSSKMATFIWKNGSYDFKGFQSQGQELHGHMETRVISDKTPARVPPTCVIP